MASTIGAGTAEGMVEWLDTMGKKGILVPNTADSIKRAATTVMREVFEEDWSGQEVSSLDVEAVFQRFQNKTIGKYTAGSLSSYKSRFNTAVEMYLGYLASPHTWKPPIKARPGAVKKRSSNRPPNDGSGPDATQSPVLPTPPATLATETPTATNFIEHQFPLRVGVRAIVRLPENLSTREAARLAAWIQTLVTDDQLALPAGGSSSESSPVA